MNPLLLVDFYKIHHNKMYPEGMTKLYSNFTPRKSRMKGVDKVVVFGIQHFVLKHIIEGFNHGFFIHGLRSTLGTEKAKELIISEYKRHCNVDTKHIEALWDLGYLPIEIKALDEGTLCPIGVPCMTITNTHPDFGWLVNYLETLISCSLWQSMTSATIAHEYKKLLIKYAKETDEKNIGFVDWQGHDFSMREMSSVESAILSGMGHLLSFTGTDTIPAIYQLEQSYNASDLIGASVPATEHSVMCMGTKESEIDTFKRLLKLYPTGILSVVSDTWDLWKVLTEYLPVLKEQILARDGKLVIRPDSGDPVDIICGDAWRVQGFTEGVLNKVGENGVVLNYTDNKYYKVKLNNNYEVIGEETTDVTPANKGVIELLWDIFGGTVNEQGYKVLDPHIGAIYGDSITLNRAEQICERLKAKGFASTNIVLGIGSYTYQYNTRDTFGFAVKATYGEVLKYPKTLIHSTGPNNVTEIPFNINNESHKNLILGEFIHTGNSELLDCREIFKDPITDDGTKKSKKGLLAVYKNPNTSYNTLVCYDQVSKEEESQGLLETVFKDGKLVKTTNLKEIRNKLNSYK